jgi:hypothetical protein
MAETEIFPKISILWDVTPCSLWKVEQCLRGICRLHLQGRRIGQARNQHEEGSKKSLFFDPEDESEILQRNAF